MWKLFSSEKSDKIDLLQKTQENVELSQQNNQLLGNVLSELIAHKDPAAKKEAEKTAEEKLKAAYALNLCTVSVSQIIDYNDIQLLETEYDAILNNLNLEAMPKDEALLRILKQLLDVITFFRIQECDKKLMEKEYAQRMKDAIWSAVPNPGVIVASGNPISIAISLASQVGIGYMNYRKEKAKISLDKERKEWELQRSAMEQFNGLRRELFDTAWRLADEYAFPDEYRITEYQISQFNNILMDVDDLRRYERLEYIQDNFKAYPPFWYYLGNAANAVYLDEKYDTTIRGEYKNRAITHFNYFFEITEQNLLRADQLVASCALEKFDLIDDKNEKLLLLEKAIKASGNAFDVLQICAVSYLKIGEVKKACDLLRMLVNESYNETLNVQLLSKLYVSQIMSGNESVRDKYKTLERRVSKPQYLFPLPLPTTSSETELEDTFILSQKRNLLKSYCDGLITYIKKCEKQYGDICMMQGNITSEMADYIKNISVTIGELLDGNYSTWFLNELHKKIEKSNFMKMIESSDERKRGIYSVEFNEIFDEAFKLVAFKIQKYVASLENMKSISETESSLYKFLIDNSLENSIALITKNYAETRKDLITEVFGNEFKNNLANSESVDKCLEVLKTEGYNQDELVIDKDAKVSFILRGEPEFKPYLERNRKTYKKSYISDDEIIAVLNDKSSADTDLIFTTSRVVVTGWVNVKAVERYKNICIDESGKKLKINDFKFHNKGISLGTLSKMIDALAKVSYENTNAPDENVESMIKKIMVLE